MPYRSIWTIAMAMSLVAGTACGGGSDGSDANRLRGTLETISTAGFTTIQGQCNNPRGSNGDLAMRFALVTEENQPIAQGDIVGEEPVELSSEQVRFDDAKISDTETSTSVQNVEYASQKDTPQRFGLLIENTASLAGFYPSQEGRNAYYDANGDGQAEVPPPTSPKNPNLASDSASRRAGALQEMLPNWRAVANQAEAQGTPTRFGFWEIEGSNRPISLVDEATGEDGKVWTRDNETVGDVINDQFSATVDEPSSRASVWQAISLTLDNYTDAGGGKFLTVLVDGPPDLPVEASGTNPAKVIQKARDNDVRVFVVQLDPAIEPRGEQTRDELLRDDPEYYRSQESTCSSESDCRSYETCREVHGYADTRGGDVTQRSGTPEAGSGNPSDGSFTPNKYCMRERGPNGRFGPVAGYARLACATEGGYRHLRTDRDLGWAMRWLPHAMDGLWKVRASIGQFLAGNFLDGSPVYIQTTMRVAVNGVIQTRTLSQQGAVQDPDNPESGDNRGVVFTQPVSSE